RASAASVSSIAWSQASSLRSPGTEPRARTPSKSPTGARAAGAAEVAAPRRRVVRVRLTGARYSDGEENGLTLSLQSNVESVAVAVGLGEQRAPPLRRHLAQYRVGLVGGRLVGEVHAGDHPIEQATGEDRDREVGGLGPAPWCRAARRLDGEQGVLSFLVRRCPGEAAVTGRRDLPGLDECIGHWLAGTVGDLAADPDRAWRPLGHGVRPGRPGKADGEERSDGLRRGQTERCQG